jgi:hypothetical protein
MRRKLKGDSEHVNVTPGPEDFGKIEKTLKISKFV